MKKILIMLCVVAGIGVAAQAQDRPTCRAPYPQASQNDDNVNCKNCEDCKNCVDCIDCKNCEGCVGCVGCDGCLDCNGCKQCTDCNGCNGCKACQECGNCNGCNDCSQCVECCGGNGLKCQKGESQECQHPGYLAQNIRPVAPDSNDPFKNIEMTPAKRAAVDKAIADHQKRMEGTRKNMQKDREKEQKRFRKELKKVLGEKDFTQYMVNMTRGKVKRIAPAPGVKGVKKGPERVVVTE